MKKILIVSTILCLVFASMFSCCFLPEAQAAVSIDESYCPHHEDESQSAHQASQSGCDCEQIIAFIAKNLFLDDIGDASVVHVLYDEKQLQLASNNFLLFTDSDPPNSGIPLYIQHSILRI